METSEENLNKSRIRLYEDLIKKYKDMLSEVFKNSKDYLCTNEELEWYKNNLRTEKNIVEVKLKEVIQEQLFIRNGLNPPFFYKNY